MNADLGHFDIMPASLETEGLMFEKMQTGRLLRLATCCPVAVLIVFCFLSFGLISVYYPSLSCEKGGEELVLLGWKG